MNKVQAKSSPKRNRKIFLAMVHLTVFIDEEN